MTVARDRLIRPYRADHETSIRMRMDAARRPHSLPQLLGWAREQWSLEVPDRLHAGGVWRDYGAAASGGSALGTPRYADPFRAYLENSAFETDGDDPTYLRPMHAALARIHGRDTSHPFSPAAHRLFALAVGGFDVGSVSARYLVNGDDCHRLPPIPVDVQGGYWTWALGLWWSRYAERTLA